MHDARHLRTFDNKWFYRDSIASVAHPLYPRMSSTLSTAHPWIFHDIPQLLCSDDKTVHGFIGVQTRKAFGVAINIYPRSGYLLKANSQ